MQAVILAAGMGTRIRDCHLLPKGFITLGHQTIIEESIQKLQACGVDEIVIVTGFSAHFYEKLAITTKSFLTIFNEKYDQCSSLYSLYCAKNWVKETVLIIESDIIYEQQAIEKIIQNTHENIILLSGKTDSGDEVYVEARKHHLVQMSKQKSQLSISGIQGEFVGINKLSFFTYQKLIDLLEKNENLLQTGYYEEDGLVALSKIDPIFCLKIPDLLWSEIDDAAQLKRAKLIYSEIKTNSVTML